MSSKISKFENSRFNIESAESGCNSIVQNTNKINNSDFHTYVNMKIETAEAIRENDYDVPPALPPRLKLPSSQSSNGFYEKILEKEEDLKRIHHRSRELISGGCGGHHFSSQPRVNDHVSRGRTRVKSPCRDDYKDFSVLRHREMISPCRSHFNSYNSYLSDNDLDTTSSAESLSDISAFKQLNRSWTHQSHHHHHPCPSHPPCCCDHHYQPQYPLCPRPDTSIQLSVENRLLALEGDKEILQLQFVELSNKLDSHNSKVSDLQTHVQNRSDDLRKTEDQLHDEVLSRSHLETKKLELMSEISGLKLRQTEMEHENKELRRKLQAVSVDRSMNNNIGFRPVSFTYHQQPKKTFTDRKETTPIRGATNFFVKNGAFKTEVTSSSGGCRSTQSGTGHNQSQSPIVKKSRGFKQLWRRMKRSQSVHIPQNENENEEVERNRFSVGSSISCESLGKISF